MTMKANTDPAITPRKVSPMIKSSEERSDCTVLTVWEQFMVRLHDWRRDCTQWLAVWGNFVSQIARKEEPACLLLIWRSVVTLHA